MASECQHRMLAILDDDSLLEVCKHIYLADLPAASAVCRSWHAVLCGRDPWYAGATASLRLSRAKAGALLSEELLNDGVLRPLQASCWAGDTWSEHVSTVYNFDDPKLSPHEANAKMMQAQRHMRIERELRTEERSSRLEAKLMMRLARLFSEFERVEGIYVASMARLSSLLDGLPVDEPTRYAIGNNTREVMEIHRDVLLPGIRAATAPLHGGLLFEDAAYAQHVERRALVSAPPLDDALLRERAAGLTPACAAAIAEELSRLFLRVSPLLLLHIEHVNNYISGAPTAAMEQLTRGRGWLPARSEAAAREHLAEHGHEIQRLLATPRSRLPRWNLLFRDLVHLIQMDGRLAASGAARLAARTSRALNALCIHLNDQIKTQSPPPPSWDQRLLSWLDNARNAALAWLPIADAAH